MGGPRQSNHTSRHRHVSPDEMNQIVIPDTQKNLSMLHIAMLDLKYL